MGTDASGKKWTVLELLNWTKDYFGRNDIDSPRLAAEVLLSEVLKCKRVELYARFNTEPTEQQRGEFRKMVKQVADGEPVAYIVGKKDFYSLTLSVSTDVLIPRSETEILVDKVLDFFRKKTPSPVAMWDLCTGSGAVALAVAANLKPADNELKILASDISEAALKIAKTNADDNKLTEKVSFACGDLFDIDSEIISSVCPSGKFDIITANPPYINDADMKTLSTQVKCEPTLALAGGTDGLDIVRKIIDTAPQYLAPGGLLVIEIGYDQADLLWELLKDSSQYCEKEFVKDLAGIDRTLVLKKAE